MRQALRSGAACKKPGRARIVYLRLEFDVQVAENVDSTAHRETLGLFSMRLAREKERIQHPQIRFDGIHTRAGCSAGEDLKVFLIPRIGWPPGAH